MERYDIIFENMKDCACIFDTHGKIEYCNPASRKLFNLEEGNIIGKKMWEIIPISEKNDDFVQMFMDSVFDKSQSHEKIVDFERNDGVLCRIRVCTSYIDSDKAGESSVLAVITDLTELQKIHNVFVRYTSEDVADTVLNTEEGYKMGGKTENITVLMSDLRGFTAISTRLSASNLIILINNYFEKMSEIIHHYKGVIIEFLGDGIFVVFGAPKHNEKHASCAVACAIEMQNAMQEVNLWNKENGFPELEMGIGINTGDCVVGNIGSMRKTKYGAIGENVNLAGRVESFTVGHQILISESTKSAISEELSIKDSLKIMPKGGKKEIEIFDISGIGGEYHVRKPEQQILLNDIKPVEVDFRILQAKSVSEDKYKGIISAISDNHALFYTEAEIHTTDNVMIDIGDDLYAKILDKKDNGFVLCFTSRPIIFPDWLRKL